jgi:hypothetical protein
MRAVRMALTGAAFCLLLLPSFRAQEAGPGSSRVAALAPPFAAVRAAWNAPEKEALAIAALPRMTLEEFTVLCVVGHDSHQSLQGLEALRQSGKSWSQVIKDLKGSLLNLVVQGSIRYQLKARELDKMGGDPEAEADILRLAQVMTLERLTGKGPAAILRELDEGRDYARLLSPNAGRGNSPTAPPADRRGRRNGWPPGLGDPGTPPASSGFVETGGGRPPGH